MDLDGPEEECNCPPEGAPAWMATFGDMMSLLVTFFVLLLSFANMDVVKFKRVMGSMKEALGVERVYVGEFNVRSTNPLELSDRPSTPFIDLTQVPSKSNTPSMDQRMMAEVQRVIAAQGMDRIVETETSERGVIVRMKGEMAFESGSDQLHPESYIFLDEIAELAKSFPYGIAVEGHTDPSPSGNPRFPTNWHLSSARAIAALRYLIEAGIPAERLSASGYGDTRPLVPNDTAEHRARNRRVEFIYLRDARLSRQQAEEAAAPEPLLPESPGGIDAALEAAFPSDLDLSR